MIRTYILLLAAASLASASTIFTVALAAGDTLADASQFTQGNSYLVVFQLTGGTTSASVASLYSIDVGGGSADPSSILQSNNVLSLQNGITDDALTLEVTPSDSYSYFIQQYSAGTHFAFTVLLSGLYSPPTPDSFTFQLYGDGGTIVYEQAFNVTSPAQVPEPGSWLLIGAGCLGLRMAHSISIRPKSKSFPSSATTPHWGHVPAAESHSLSAS